jgi:hypothetical protein
MIIDTDTFKNIARQIINSHNTFRQNDMEFKKNYIRARVDLILKQLDTIRAIAPAFNMLKTAKIKFIDTFFTDSYHRNIGFSISRNDLIGICGRDNVKSVFVNFRNEKFIVCDQCYENGLCVREINIDELIKKYWDNDHVRRYLDQIACGITEFVERVAINIVSAV